MRCSKSYIIIFLLFKQLCAYAQDSLIFSGKFINGGKGEIPDTSILVTLYEGELLLAAQHLNKNAEYKIKVKRSAVKSDSLLLSWQQDTAKFKKVYTGLPCNLKCILNNYWFSDYRAKRKYIKINTTGVNEYKEDFKVMPLIRDPLIESLYFDKNSYKIASGHYYNNPDSALCVMVLLLKCRSNFVISISGYATPFEKRKRALARKRAKEVKHLLVQNGINPKRLIINNVYDKYYDENNAAYAERKKWDTDLKAEKEKYFGQLVEFMVLRKDFKE